MKNNKGFIVPSIGITLTVGTLIVIAIIVALVFGGTFGLLALVSKYSLTLAGLFLLVVALVVGTKSKHTTLPILFGLVGVFLVILPFTGLQQSFLGTGLSAVEFSQVYVLPIALVIMIGANIYLLVANKSKKRRY